MKKIIFTGGGTLGHVMPNLYLIDELKDCEALYIGSNGIEKEVVKNKGIKYYEIPATKFKRNKFFENFKIPFVLIKAINSAKKILKKEKPNLIFSKGGYVSLPVCLAARKLKIPIIAHESDFSFGLANRIILKLCNVMCVNFKNLEKPPKIMHTGPIFSKEFENKQKNYINLNLEPSKPTILIVGGSLGSKTINSVILNNEKELIKSFNIIHITGKGNNIKGFKNYNTLEATSDINNLYNIADFVISRAGAGVTAECAFKNLPMFLIPLENKATRGDQLQNAIYYKNLGIAEILQEKDLKTSNFIKKIENFYKNLNIYNKNYENIQQTNGKEKVLYLIKQYTNKGIK